MTTPSLDTFSMQRSLRQCLANMAALLYRQGHVLESVTVPHRGLDTDTLQTLKSDQHEWSACQRILESSKAATWNDQRRFVLTGMGRELLFDMFGEGAADCA